MGKVVKLVLFGSLGMIASISALQAIGSTSEDVSATHRAAVPETATDAPPTASAPGAATLPPTSTTALPIVADAVPSPKPKPVKLADLDEADRAIRLAINQSGHLCARPTEVREVAADLYGVHCITNRNGTGGSNYLVNSRTNEVEEI